MPAVKERPILFSGPMIRAILDGRKTVTRRIIKPEHSRLAIDNDGNNCVQMFQFPHGQTGDRLWVRETWAEVGHGDPGHIVYRATYPRCLPPGIENVPADIREAGYRWRPSIHMPRRLCRILLEITDVRVERLHDITEEQAIAEGCEAIDNLKWHTFEEAAAGVPMHDHTARDAFEVLWESINGKGSWDENPWVWCISFRRIES